MQNKANSFGPSCKQKSSSRIKGDDGRSGWNGAGATERPAIKPLFHRDVLLEKRICLLERLAECANEIKRIDEQLKSI